MEDAAYQERDNYWNQLCYIQESIRNLLESEKQVPAFSEQETLVKEGRVDLLEDIIRRFFT